MSMSIGGDQSFTKMSIFQYMMMIDYLDYLQGFSRIFCQTIIGAAACVIPICLDIIDGELGQTWEFLAGYLGLNLGILRHRFLVGS